jgi:hypothetical protein
MRACYPSLPVPIRCNSSGLDCIRVRSILIRCPAVRRTSQLYLEPWQRAGAAEAKDVTQMPGRTTRFIDQASDGRRLDRPLLSPRQGAALQALAAILTSADTTSATWLIGASIAICLVLTGPLTCWLRRSLNAIRTRGSVTAIPTFIGFLPIHR